MKVFLIRHTETEQSLKNYILDDDKDFSLSDIGIATANKLKNFFVNQNIDKVYSSPHNRAMQTAHILFPDKEVLLVEDLREINKGFDKFLKNNPNLSHMSTMEWEEEHRRELAYQDRFKKPYPSGEAISDMYKRVGSAFENILKKNTNDLAIVANNGPIKSILAKFSDQAEKFYFETKLPYGSVSILSINKDKVDIEQIS